MREPPPPRIVALIMNLTHPLVELPPKVAAGEVLAAVGNVTTPIEHAGGSLPDAAASATKPISLLLLVVPLLTMCVVCGWLQSKNIAPAAFSTGNILVIAAVWRERSLQTVTNWLIGLCDAPSITQNFAEFLVSLAVSDLLVSVELATFQQKCRSHF